MSANPYESWEDTVEGGLDPQGERAWVLFRNVEAGDEIVWGNRQNALVVNNKTTTDGLVELEVEGPRGGTYTVRERYDEMDRPNHYADDSDATDIRFAREDREAGTRLSASEYEELVIELETQALNTYDDGDFSNYRSAVRTVVDDWSADVQFGRWGEMSNANEALSVFQSVIDHSPQLKDTFDENRSPQYRAEMHLVDTITDRSEEDADLSMVRDGPSYKQFVERTAENAIDRLQTERYNSASLAARDTTDRAISGHSDEFYRQVIQHSDRRPMDYGYYAETAEGDEQYKEMAFDVMTDDVREKVREIRRQRGTHDPRPGGLRWEQYDSLVEGLVEDTIREHRINDNRLVRETAESVVGGWANQVESGVWSFEGDEYDAQDAEDVFGSVTLHSKHEPSGFNPFSEESYRETAVDVLVEDIEERYDAAMNPPDSEPVPADKYLDDVLGFGFTYEELRNDQELSTEDFIREALTSYEGDVSNLAGWTFIDELVTVYEFNVPRFSTEWLLVDYGLVEEDNRFRHAAWFHRQSGDVVQIHGATSNPPEDGEYTYGDFNLMLMRWNDPEPEFLAEDADIQTVMETLYDYLGGNSADVQMIETAEGEYYIRDSFEEGDIDGGSLLSNVAPGLDVPGVGLVPEVVRKRAGGAYKRVTAVAREKMQLQADAKRYAILVFMELVPFLSQKTLAGTEIQPIYQQNKGVGLKIMNTVGASADEQGVGGSVRGEVYLRPQSLRNMRDNVFGRMWEFGNPRVDVSAVDERINQIVESVEDKTSKARALYLINFLPMTPRGAPTQRMKYASKKYAAQNDDGNGNNAWYTLMPGETLDDDELRRRISFVQELRDKSGTGVGDFVGAVYLDADRWGSGPANLMDMDTLENSDIPRDDPNFKLPTELAEEIGWSLTASKARELFGPEDQVGKDYPGRDTPKYVGSYETFLDLYEHFAYAPSKSVVGQGFKWLIEQGRESDSFTMADAYHAFRTSVVFNEHAQKRDDIIADFIENGVIDPETLFDGTVATTGESYLDSGMAEGGVAFIWDFPIYSDLGNVWDGKDLSDVEQLQMAPGNNGYGASRYWLSEGKSGVVDDEQPHYDLYHNKFNSGRVDDFDNDDKLESLPRDKRGPPSTVVTIDSSDKLWEYMNPDARQLVVDELKDIEFSEYDIDEDGQTGGTSLDITGVFTSAMSAAAGFDDRDGSFMSSNRIFPLQLNDIPGVNFDPERPDIPSFRDWRRSRMGLIGDDVSQSQARGRYLRDVSQYVDPGIGDLLGFDENAEFESQANRQITEGDGDYEDYQDFYADEFGESFEDVEQRFASERPVGDETGSDDLSSSGTPEVGEDIDDEDFE